MGHGGRRIRQISQDTNCCILVAKGVDAGLPVPVDVYAESEKDLSEALRLISDCFERLAEQDQESEGAEDMASNDEDDVGVGEDSESGADDSDVDVESADDDDDTNAVSITDRDGDAELDADPDADVGADAYSDGETGTDVDSDADELSSVTHSPSDRKPRRRTTESTPTSSQKLKETYLVPAEQACASYLHACCRTTSSVL